MAAASASTAPTSATTAPFCGRAPSSPTTTGPPMSDPAELLRPRDFALLLLASGDAAPRHRARDQRADRAGLGLKRRVLAALVERDPGPDEVEAALMEVVEEVGPPTGPTRSVAALVLQE